MIKKLRFTRRLLGFAVVASATVFLSGPKLQADIIYEGFEYTAGANVVGLNGGTGFGGAYTETTAAGVGTGAANVDAGVGFTFGTLDVAGGSLERTIRDGRGAISRAISSGAQAAFADGSTVFFSVLMDPTINTGGTGGQSANSYATLIIGTDGLTDVSNGTQAGTGTLIGGSGDAFGVGFFGGTGVTFPGVGIQGLSFDDGAINQDNGVTNGVVTGDVVSFIVGSLELNAAGTDDVLTLYNVLATDTGLGTAFATVTADLDNANFDTLSIADGQTAGFDEIRFGTTLDSVTPGLFTAVPEPSSLLILGFSGVALLVRRRR